jgi:PASTA domain
VIPTAPGGATSRPSRDGDGEALGDTILSDAPPGSRALPVGDAVEDRGQATARQRITRPLPLQLAPSHGSPRPRPGGGDRRTALPRSAAPMIDGIAPWQRSVAAAIAAASSIARRCSAWIVGSVARRWRRSSASVVATVVAAALAIGLLLAAAVPDGAHAAGSPRLVTVPSVQGLSPGPARHLLAEHGLRCRLSPGTAAGSVVESQRPGPGDRVARRSTVVLTVVPVARTSPQGTTTTTPAAASADRSHTVGPSPPGAGGPPGPGPTGPGGPGGGGPGGHGHGGHGGPEQGNQG